MIGVYLTRLDIARLRCLKQASVEPCAGLNLLLGGNGAGKTSVLEGLFLLGSGRSFRSGGHEAMIQSGAHAAQVYAELVFEGRHERVGIERARSRWQALHNGARVADLAELASLVPVVCFSPDSHELVSGGAEARRRFFDWIVFHVEPGFTEVYRRYSRVLRQRNALLKTGPADTELETWTLELASSGERVAECRSRVFPRFAEAMGTKLGELLGELGEATILFRRGWREGIPLLERLRMIQNREREVGHTLAGPHRADWMIHIGNHEIRDHGSRGQQKLVALSAVLVAAQLYQQRRGHPPIVVLDDLASELDTEHQQRALLACAALGAQLWVSGTQGLLATEAWMGERRVFHVERGEVSAMPGG
ncbi:MAG: DNA replication/repair protein RecF [Xanthomonadales bacterium]|nr:DNA replication and repair protein RecF [Xanthomonadales bacterium]MCC6592169.1 DNA replication/repair protein RecF [Xanthomonadales bacterium]MCE7930309.1 DNA replication/repair protein RecF [Xanthomonadales bacterium PRO6]